MKSAFSCKAILPIGRDLGLAIAILVSGSFSTAKAAWIDAATGHPVQVEPYIDPNTGGRNYDYASGHAVYHGHNLFWDSKCGTWRDAASNHEIHVEPYIDPNTGGRNYDYASGHAVYHGHNLAWVPCPPPKQPAAVQSAPVLPFSFGIGIGIGNHERCGFGMRCKDEK